MHSTLNINNRKAFDQAVFQTDTEFDTLKYNEWKDNATKALQRIYDQIDDIPSIETADCYILGDIINLLSDMTIDADYESAMEKLIAIIENNPKADIESDADNTPYINE